MSSTRLLSPFTLPVFFNTTDMLAVVVGGGPVGQRKAQMLLAAGATVRVVALEPRPDDCRDENLDWFAEPYRPELLDGARLIFTAAPLSVCRQVHEDARARGLLVCRADDSAAGDFITPTTIARGNLRIAVSTGGASPALARAIRERLAETFDEPFAEWVELLANWRRRAGQGRWQTQFGHHEFLEQISDWSWLDHFRQQGRDAINAAYAALAEELGLRGPVV